MISVGGGCDIYGGYWIIQRRLPFKMPGVIYERVMSKPGKKVRNPTRLLWNEKLSIGTTFRGLTPGTLSSSHPHPHPLVLLSQ
ncbi:hypothetical protein KQX54_009250 [Cotesia glomerata]|uniref:Uncharacterized protein n=1 Tax=Cotesia glomerata TaxID=32391 RepID=A0AAV7J4B3_COTGL|nr:hypothetical protein KQX54_009250 [Cotesia glomerata]